MKLSVKIVAASLVLLLGAIASAQTLTGTLKNGTTGKPAAGDDVILIKLAQGMEEAARTKADASGHFTFKLPDAGPHLIRAIHQGGEESSKRTLTIDVREMVDRNTDNGRARAAQDNTVVAG